MNTEPLISTRQSPEWVTDMSSTNGERNILRDLSSAMWRRKWLIGATTALCFGLSAAVVTALPPVYRTSSTVLIEARRLPAATAEGATEVPVNSETATNELQVLQSRELLGQVVRHLGLERDPTFNRELRPSLLGTLTGEAAPELPAAGDEQAIDAAVSGLLRHLRVSLIGRSRAIEISLRAPDPMQAARIANTMAELYVAGQIARRAAETREFNTWINERLDELRVRARASARAVEEFRAAQGLVRGVARGDREADLLRQEIAEVNQQLTAARARQGEATARLAEAERALAARNMEGLAAVLGSQTIQQLRAQESQIAARQAEQTALFGSRHPTLAATSAELADVRARIQAEAQRILASFRSDLRLAREAEAGLTQRVDDLRAQVARLGTVEVQMQDLQREAEADRALVESFLARARGTSPEASGFQAANARLVSRAVAPREPYAPNRKILLPLALIVSLGFGGLAGLLAEARSRGFRSMDDIRRILGLNPLGILPLVRGRRDRAVAEDAAADLCARVLLPAEGRPPRSVLLTSAMPGEGKTTTAQALARAAAGRGLRVLLMDADLRGSPNAASGGEASGLAEVLRGATKAEDAVRHDPEAGLWLLPAGASRGSEVSRLLTSERLEKVLEQLERGYDLVVIDAAPALVGADIWRLARHADQTLFLTRWMHTPRSTVATALRQVLAAGGRVPGVVLTMVDTRKNARYGHGDAVMFSPAMQRYYADGRRSR
ncbi:GumC family protein [Roseicella aerolata]|uniref:non-specific protein-tyrosine kinase n=1 Tax=Roseicella aerolata TaxID=2883479 RepID=A0A9X1IAS3_9PROT|nr:polysaccharide biosynthesis tyrosine autokinase [Roseicella aerolata]MCB4821355.1 polysaccharide biosynthesis tyrosine autokinase [Roseicella aerolata]